MQKLITRSITAISLAALFFGLYVFTPAWTISAIFCIALAEILIFEWPAFNVWILTPLYPILPFVCLIALNQSANRSLFLATCSIVFIHDSVAYLVGSRWGRWKILPQISPGKSIEGFLAGTIASGIVALFLLNSVFLYTFTRAQVLFILVINIMALIGDLFESYLKRRAGLKDSGALLPGHGGLLDRLDGLFFAATFTYIISLIFNLF